VTVSAALHAFVLAALIVAVPAPPPPSPPLYRVNLVAAPPGDRAVGVVRPQPEPPRRTPAQATPTPEPAKPAPRDAAAPAPAAGGGPVGGRGADVASVRTEGIDFPYPGYLQNIVRQIALRFKPPRGGARRAEVMFLIHRDGSISNLNFRVASGSYAFDVEARGAVESAAQAGAFGPLPRGFPDDVLPVIFSFDPRLIR
jgi:protein TonB